MKIGVDGRRIRPFAGGIGQFTEQLSRALDRENQAGDREIILYAFAQDKLKQFNSLTLELTPVTVNHPRENFYFRREIAQKNIDVFFSPSRLIPETDLCKVITVIHDLCFKNFPNLYPEVLLEKEKITTEKKISNSDLIMAVSEQTKKDILSYFGVNKHKIEILHQSVPPEFSSVQNSISFNPPWDKPFLLFVGTLQPRKNLRVLIDAFNIVSNDIPHDLVLVGQQGWDYKKIQDKIEKSPVTERIKLPGVILSNEKLAQIYQATDLLVFPSLCEGFGRPLLEAMHCQTPVLCSDIPVHREVAGEAARFFPPEEPEVLAKEIKKVTTSDSIKEKLVRKGEKQAKEYSWKKAARKLLEEARGLVGSGRGDEGTA